jgi:hypothetical protein
VIVVVLVVAAALLIHGCQVSQTNNSLKTYAGTVSEYVTASNKNGKNVFKDLKSGDATSNLASLQLDLSTAVQRASTQLQQAQDLSTPGPMASAEQSFVEMMKLRYDGINQIASHIQGAMNRSTAVDDVSAITAGTSMLFASDVIYKTSVGTAIASALNAAGLPIGGTTGVTINSGQVVPDLGWLNHVTVALWLGATVPTKSVNSDQPGLHGHSLNSVSVGGTTLSTTALNTIPLSKQAPSFTLNLTNGGSFNEFDVTCKVSIKGVSDTGKATIAETTPLQTTSCDVTLPTVPPTGSYKVTAEVEPVPGEKNTANNTQVFDVDFN